MRNSMIIGCLFLTATTALCDSWAGESRPEIRADLILEKFDVATGGNLLQIPVRIGEFDHHFVVDTGASLTVLDVAACTGERLGSVCAKTPTGDVSLTLHTAPEVRIGNLRLGPLPFVGGYNLKRLSREAGQSMDGILGMDFLSRHVVHIDFDEGKLLFLKSHPENAGEPMPLACDLESGCPWVFAEPSFGATLPFLVDTGACTSFSGALGGPGLRHLTKRRTLPVAGSYDFMDASGISRSKLFSGDLLRMGSFSVNEPLFHEVAVASSLDLGFWSRFVVTFDFPKNKLYLRKGKQYSRPERQFAGIISTSIKCDTESLSKLSKRESQGFAPDPAPSRFDIRRPE
jgi:gag-polyprotein putative aspartyl protease